MYIVESYLTYLVITVGVTIWVGRTLYRGGRVFLVDAFGGNKELADSVNHLLVVGFYLVNIGFLALALSTNRQLPGLRQAVELVADKTGVALLVLGAMHFFNLYLFSRVRRRQMRRVEPPPLPPDARLA